jgi:hypothetical protein
LRVWLPVIKIVRDGAMLSRSGILYRQQFIQHASLSSYFQSNRDHDLESMALSLHIAVMGFHAISGIVIVSTSHADWVSLSTRTQVWAAVPVQAAGFTYLQWPKIPDFRS